MMKIQNALIQQALIAHESQIEKEYQDYSYHVMSTEVKYNLGRHHGYVVQCESLLDVTYKGQRVGTDPYTTSVWFNDDLTIEEII